LVLSEGRTSSQIYPWIGVGVRGYALKAAKFPQLQRAVGIVLSGGIHIPNSLPNPLTEFSRLSRQRPHGGLTSALAPRQSEILGLVLLGYDAKAIAQRLNL